MMKPQTQTPSKEMIGKWINQNILAGKTIEELVGTLFVYGNEAHSLTKTASGELGIEVKEVSQVVIFRKEEEEAQVNMCHACGLDYQSYKDALQCCAYIE